MVWVVGIVSSLAGVVIATVSGAQWRRAHERRGRLAGDWFQITYQSDDGEMAGVPHSIEWVETRHRGRDDQFSGSFWRVHNEHHERCWEVIGRVHDSVIDGLYWCTNKEGGGGEGSLHLWMTTDGRYCGKYVQTIRRYVSGVFETSFEEKPLEWVRIGTDAEHRATFWMPASIYDQCCLTRMPRRVLQRVPGCPPIRWYHSMGYATTATSSAPAQAVHIEHERVVRRRRHRAARERDLAPEHNPDAASVQDESSPTE